MSTSCNPNVWQARMLDARVKSSAQIQGALVQKYFQECRTELETGDNSGLVNLRKMMTMNYNPQGHPFLRRVVVNLPGNVRLKGLLGLKGDFKRRPFVIMRLGIFSSVEDFRPERAWLMMLFEQSPFNVLVLENMTSGDFVADNNQFSFGGYDEGIQNLLLARMLRDSNEPLSKVVDSVHMFGVSLGGHGVLFSSLLSKYNSPANYPLIQSSLAFCPVVHLQETMQNLTQSGVKSAFVDLWSRRRLSGLDQKLPSLVQYESFSFLTKAISEVVRNYHGGLSYISNVKLPPGMKDGAEFWALNDFWKSYNDVQEPVMILATSQDPLVPFEMNSQNIANKKLKIGSKNVKVVELPQGYHCTLPVPYDWKALTTVFQSYVLSHSPGFHLKERNLTVDLSDDEWKGFFEGPVVTNFEVREPAKDQKFVRLEIKMTNGKKDDRSMNLSLPLSEFDFRFLNKDLTLSEKEMIVRWLNQNLRVSLMQNSAKASLKVTWPVAL
ncbi:alpha/beta hydrolase family protein [Bdellovibrio svalbardensis]|uniref:Alpha/beta hydrolase n=1 Tax=Bdellovibrio svalbardensis TaxID=2972972 RepID=A0ABT6DJ10_9BACT|nr:hypothetical protein [Bdellovibrio svalbardensis]MDG0816839.1 alpha/beta hydrolase [Bdellovibrio svalbardensis]